MVEAIRSLILISEIPPPVEICDALCRSGPLIGDTVTRIQAIARKFILRKEKAAAQKSLPKL